ncbi:uncharacterized protein BKA55DRAFT_682091 [Fusarium redolens]|uniref:DUF7908 domain-containing protein n=1 Tax=Fusarium redolens TaxID=48865 RepID=A0A9P9KUW9_FUSRE|nr:uncharacterized protein BKA55DRAFT_682091 [Fusarium redolens]KAH7268997.1 hypothetical protein BKA55DRAFT_682091 [Fusarium redolens]
MRKLIPALVRDFEFALHDRLLKKEWATQNYWFIKPLDFQAWRDLSKREDKGFVGQDNPNTCTFASRFNLVDGQLLNKGVPISYSGEAYVQLEGEGLPGSDSITTTFETSGRDLVFRNAALPNGEAGFCQVASGQVYVTFSSSPAGCEPVNLAAFDTIQCQNGRLVGYDTTTSEAASETATSSEIASETTTTASATVTPSNEATATVAPESVTTTADSSSTKVSSFTESGVFTSLASTTELSSFPESETSTVLASMTESSTPTSGVSSETELLTTEITTTAESESTTVPASTASTTESPSATASSNTFLKSETTSGTSTTVLVASTDTEISSTEATTTIESEITTAIVTTTTEASTTNEEPTTTTADTTTADEATTTEFTTTADTTTTTSSGPDPSSCASTSDPYSVGGSTFDINCNFAVTGGTSIGIVHANSFQECYDVAIKQVPETTTTAAPT